MKVLYRYGVVGSCPRCIRGWLVRAYLDQEEAACLQCGYVNYGEVPSVKQRLLSEMALEEHRNPRVVCLATSKTPRAITTVP